MPNKFQAIQAATLKGFFRAMADHLDPFDIAAQILGYPHSNNAFIYLFRRFGYPRFGWASEVDIVQYHITTPNPEVHLSVGLRGEGVYFGYCLSEKGQIACSDEQGKYNEAAVASGGDFFDIGNPPEGTQTHRYTNALKAALNDLLRPVCIYQDDDQIFANIKGVVDLDGSQAYLEPSPMAGYGMDLRRQ